MIDLNKYDSEESKSSYRAKNSKEIKHLKGEVKRLRAENASLKSACKLAEKQKVDVKNSEDDKTIELFFFFMLAFLFAAYTSFKLADKVDEYKSKYEQCQIENSQAALNSSNLQEIQSSIIKSKQIVLAVSNLSNEYQRKMYGYASQFEPIGLNNTSLAILEGNSTSMNVGYTLNTLEKIAMLNDSERHKKLIEYDPLSQIFQMIVDAVYNEVNQHWSNLMKPESSE